MFIASSHVRELMNIAGRARTPFLFGIDHELDEGFVLTDPMYQQQVLFDVAGKTNSQLAPTPIAAHHLRLTADPEPLTRYAERFGQVMAALRRGDTYLANLTIRTPVSSPLGLEQVYATSAATYRLLVPRRFVCFSPERFVRIEHGRIHAHPMKGTIAATDPGAEQAILEDPKELAEHVTIVDLLRNDLSLVAEDVRVTRFRYLDRLQTSNGPILQVSSQVSGQLPADHLDQLGEIVFALLPAGSITGAPKPSTVALLAAAEGCRRGYFTGVAGYFDGTSLDSFVLIRFIEDEGGQLVFRSGGGITLDSDCEREYREALHKVYLPTGR